MSSGEGTPPSASVPAGGPPSEGARDPYGTTPIEGLPDTPPDRRAAGDWGPIGPVRTEYPEGYRLVSGGPVRYLPVYQGDTLLGYVWAAESDDAAGFAERTLPGGNGARALTAWIRRFEECKSQGVTPLQGLRRWKGAAEHPVAGRVPADAQEGTAANSKEVETYTWQTRPG